VYVIEAIVYLVTLPRVDNCYIERLEKFKQEVSIGHVCLERAAGLVIEIADGRTQTLIFYPEPYNYC
jgi:hypothetical protein